MKFITKRDSETGKKFAEYEAKRQEAIKATHNFVFTEIGASEYRSKSSRETGGISSLIFGSDFIIPDYFKKIRSGEYMPRASVKEGKGLLVKIQALPTVSNCELNNCIGFDDFFNTIGFDPRNNKYFIFSVKEEWDIQIPPDCEEITTTRYKELVPNDKQLKND